VPISLRCRSPFVTARSIRRIGNSRHVPHRLYPYWASVAGRKCRANSTNIGWVAKGPPRRLRQAVPIMWRPRVDYFEKHFKFARNLFNKYILSSFLAHLWRLLHLNKNVFNVFNVRCNVLYKALFIILRIKADPKLLKVLQHIITIVKVFDKKRILI